MIKVCDIEDLKKNSGFIHEKGANMTCPKDGKMGASCDDALSSEDNAFNATFESGFTTMAVQFSPVGLSKDLSLLLGCLFELLPSRLIEWVFLLTTNGTGNRCISSCDVQWLFSDLPHSPTLLSNCEVIPCTLDDPC